jgi:phosphatidylglycerol:prolipoprotein diacylglycerol transferase
VNFFSWLVALGAALGLGWVVWRAPAEKAQIVLEAGLWVLFGALAGGRLAFVAGNWPYFQSYLWETWQVFRGGLAWPGALGGGLLALVIFARLSRQSLGELADALLPLLAALAVAVCAGCWLEGCAYGPQVDAWWGLPAADEWGLVARRLPLQFISALLLVLIFWQAEALARAAGRPAGAAASLALLGLALLLLAVSLLRADPALLWRGQRLDTWSALIFLCLFGVLTVRTWLSVKKPPEPAV